MPFFDQKWLFSAQKWVKNSENPICLKMPHRSVLEHPFSDTLERVRTLEVLVKTGGAHFGGQNQRFWSFLAYFKISACYFGHFRLEKMCFSRVLVFDRIKQALSWLNTHKKSSFHCNLKNQSIFAP